MSGLSDRGAASDGPLERPLVAYSDSLYDAVTFGIFYMI